MNNKRLDPKSDSRYTIREEISNNGVKSDLSIKRTERTDSALFTCVATNAFGSDDTSINMIVQGWFFFCYSTRTPFHFFESIKIYLSKLLSSFGLLYIFIVTLNTLKQQVKALDIFLYTFSRLLYAKRSNVLSIIDKRCERPSTIYNLFYNGYTSVKIYKCCV